MVKPIKKPITVYQCSCCKAHYDNKGDAERCCSGLGYHDQWGLWDSHMSLYETDMPNHACGHGEK